MHPLLPDFIGLGTDTLNPIVLKRDFGKAIAFWGGGVETQNVLPFGKPPQVKDNILMIEYFYPIA